MKNKKELKEFLEENKNKILKFGFLVLVAKLGANYFYQLGLMDGTVGTMKTLLKEADKIIEVVEKD